MITWNPDDLARAEYEAKRAAGNPHPDGTLPPREIRIHSPRPTETPLSRCLCGHDDTAHTGYLPRGQSDAVCAAASCGCQWYEPALTRRQRLTNTLVWLTITASLIGLWYLVVVAVASVVTR